MTLALSAWVMRLNSPVVPHGTMPVIPCSMSQSTRLLNAGSLNSSFLSKGVTIAGSTPSSLKLDISDRVRFSLL